VLSERTVHLPALPVPLPVVLAGPRVQLARDEPRVAAVARLATRDGEPTVVSTHLSFLAGWNVLQLRRLVQGLAGETPLVVAGDLTCGPRRCADLGGCVRWRQVPPSRRRHPPARSTTCSPAAR
jgi:endonuclease/exonuclease/phosphatase family metal-dependent hydrolase